MDRFNPFETDASKALFLTTYRCPNNGGKGYEVLLLVDSADSAMDEIRWRVTGFFEDNELSRKQLDMWDDMETFIENLTIVELPLGERTIEKVNEIIESRKIHPGFVIGSIDDVLNRQLEGFILDMQLEMPLGWFREYD